MSDEVGPEVIKKTQKLLGKYIKKPPLTEKLLRKPPFRFLHDVIHAVIKETGFLKGLFSEEELNSENVKDKDAKISFLNKLIDAVKAVTKTELAVRSSKIIAGLEPTKTNLLLQTIGKAIDTKINSSEYVAQMNSGKTESTEKKKSKKTAVEVKDIKPNKSRNRDDVTTKAAKGGKGRVRETPKYKDKGGTLINSSRNAASKAENKTSKTDVKSDKAVLDNEKAENTENGNKAAESATQREDIILPPNAHANSDTINDIDQNNEQASGKESEPETPQTAPAIFMDISEKANDIITEKDDSVENKQAEHKSSVQSIPRPKSARPKSGDRRNISLKQKSATGEVYKDEVMKPLEMTVKPPSQRPKSSLRPPSVRPSSARPGAPRLKPDSAVPLQETVTMGNINVIVENVDNVDDEETVVIQNTSEVIDDNVSHVDVPSDNKGHLVEQILEQIQEDGEALKRKVDIDWDEDALHDKDGAAKEINQLRSLIQTLTRTANPLGKLMNYLHEDVDAMHGELQMWINIKKQLFSDIHKQKRLSVESNKPLIAHLEQLQEEIKKQQQEILNVRGNILKNELRIKELLNV